MAQDTPIERSPQEKIGWNYMLAGFILLLLAGVAYYFLAPRGEDSVYNTIGHYLMAAGIAVYITGRVVRYRGRKEREQGAKMKERKRR